MSALQSWEGTCGLRNIEGLLTENWAKVSRVGKTTGKCTNEEHKEDLYAANPGHIRVRAIEEVDIESLVDTKRVYISPGYILA